MKNIIFVVCASLISVGFFACTYRSALTPVDASNVSTQSRLIYGETPEEFYGAFYFNPVSFCPQPWYRYAGAMNVLIGRDELGRKLFANIKLVIHQGGTYELYYEESSFADDSKHSPIVQQLNEHFSRRWSVDGTKIHFEDLGDGTALKIGRSHTILLVIGQDIIRSGLKGRTVIVQTLTSDAAPIYGFDTCAEGGLRD